MWYMRFYCCENPSDGNFKPRAIVNGGTQNNTIGPFLDVLIKIPAAAVTHMAGHQSHYNDLLCGHVLQIEIISGCVGFKISKSSRIIAVKIL